MTDGSSSGAGEGRRTGGIGRRAVLAGLAGTGAMALGSRLRPFAPGVAGAAGAPTPATVTVELDRAIGVVPPGMVGFGFEKRTLDAPVFSADNAALVALFRLIGPAVLRIGGNSVEKVVWDPLGSGLTADKVSPADVERLRAFADAVDGQVIYSTPFVTGTPAGVAAEAAEAMQVLGPRLAAIELCNEPDIYFLDAAADAVAGGTKFLPRWDAFAAAVRAENAAAPIAGPSSFFLNSTGEFLSSFATADRPVALLTQHYYRGFGLTPQTIDEMLSPDPLIPAQLPLIAARARELGVEYRIDEANSFSNGGQPGVSNTLASALFGIELVFTAAAYGCAGVNFHTSGTGAGYPAISQVDGVIEEIRPLYYGLLLASRAGSGSLLGTTVTSSSALRAHAVAHSSTSLSIVVTNPDPSQPFDVVVQLGRSVVAAQVSHLLGPALDATDGTTFAGAEVGIDGSYAPDAPESLPASGSEVSLTMPAASAALVEVTVVPPPPAPAAEQPVTPVVATPQLTG